MSTLDYCIQKAREIPYVKGEQRHYSLVLDKRGKILAESANSYVKTHPMMHRHSKRLGMFKDFIHSEVNALIKDKTRKGVKLIVVRVNAKGEPCNSEPCCVCKEIIKNFKNIKSVEYSV